MADLAALLQERERVVNEALELADGYAEHADDPTYGERLIQSRERIVELDAAIAKADEETSAIEAIRKAAEARPLEAYRAARRPLLYGGGGEESEMLTPGEAFIRSTAYRRWMDEWKDGGPPEGIQARSGAADAGAVHRLMLGLQTPTERMRAAGLRALVTSSDTSAGALVEPSFRGLLEPGLVRPLTIRQLLTVIPVVTDAVEYVREASRVSAAAPVAEATAVTGTSGTKPEGGVVFELVTVAIRTLAAWVPVTKRILADAPALRAYIDQYLSDDLAIELEDQVITGSGSGENFTGIFNTTGTNTAGPHSGSDTILDSIRTAIRLVVVNGRTRPTAVVVTPEDAEAIERLKDSQSRYIGAGPFGSQFTTVWGVPLIESEAIPTGFALVGDFRKAVLFDRESTSISVGTANDDFIRNLVRVLAEMRAGFGVLRPAAFTEVDTAP